MAKAGGTLRGDTLTVNERVLLHLRESGASRDQADSFSVTQPGIARSLGIRVNHVSRAVKALIHEHIIIERSAHVRGEVRKRKIYELTEEGHGLAQRLLSDVAARTIVAVDDEGKRVVGANSLRQELTPPTFTHLLTRLDGNGTVDLRSSRKDRASEPVGFEEGRPPKVELVDRGSEREGFLKWVERGPPVLAVVAPKGMGRSALVSACIPADRHLFWWSLRPADTADAFLEGLGTWLARMGKDELRTRIAKSLPGWREVARIVTKDLRGTDAILVLDDYDTADKDLEPYLDGLLESSSSVGCKVAVTLEEALPSRMELLAQGTLQELELKGLDRKAARALLPSGIGDKEFERIYRLTGGSPLSLKLLAMEEAKGDFSAEERALLRVLRLRQDER